MSVRRVCGIRVVSFMKRWFKRFKKAKFFYMGMMASVVVGVGWGSPLPDKSLTPGETNPYLTKGVLCSDGIRTEDYRHVSLSTKRRVFEEYGIPWEKRGDYEVDHLVSLELGGSNDIKNLWPEAYEPRPGAKEKDQVENYLHRQVCQGKMSLEAAQEAIADDWMKVYREMIP